MRTLYLKELRTLLPLSFLMMLTNSGDLLYRPFDERLDEASWTHISSYLLTEQGSMDGVVFAIFGMLVAFSLFPREHSERTIEFLYSLPISRKAIFLSKVLAGITALALPCIVLQCTDGLLQSWNPQSFTGEQWRADISIKIAVLHTSVSVIFLFHGLFISFFRRFGLILYAIFAWIIFALERLSPFFAKVNFLNILSMEYEGSSLVMPWNELSLHLFFALLLTFFAFVLWMGHGEALDRIWKLLENHLLGKIAIGCSTPILVVVGFALFIFVIGDDPENPDEQPADFSKPSDQLRRPGKIVHTNTHHFAFSYIEHEKTRVQPLFDRADELYKTLQHHLGTTPNDTRIVVDLSEQSAHHEGITSWTKIRLSLNEISDESHLLRTFVHELAHSFSQRESKRRISDHSQATHVFNEGCSEYFSFEIVPGPELLRTSRRTAVAAWKRHNIRFEDIIDQHRLEARYDPLLAYTIGETWVEGLVRACGTQAPGNVLRAMGRPNAPQNLSALAFWQDTLQASECNLEEVVAAWTGLMNEYAEQEEAFLAALPRIGGGVARSDGGDLVIVGTLDRDPLPLQEFPFVSYSLVFRNDVDDTQVETRSFRGRVVENSNGRTIEYRIPRSIIRGRRFQMAFGIKFDRRGWAYFEPWQEANLR